MLQSAGFGLSVPDVTQRSAAEALAWLADPDRRASAREAAAAARLPNGAGAAMRLVESAIEGARA